MSSRKETKLLVESFRIFLKEAPKKSKSNDSQMGFDFSPKSKPAPVEEPKAAASGEKLVLLDLDGTLWDKKPTLSGAPMQIPSFAANYFMKSTKESLENNVKGGPFAGSGKVFDGTISRVKELKAKGYNIIILTARKYAEFDRYIGNPKEGPFIQWMEKSGLTLIKDAAGMTSALEALLGSLGVPYDSIYPVNATSSKPEIYKRRAVDDLLKTQYPEAKELVIIDDELAETMEKRAGEAKPGIKVTKIMPS